MTQKEKIQNFVENYLVLIPIMLAIAVIPLIVRVTFFDPGLADYAWFANTTEVFDMFMYYKNQAMMQLDAMLVVAYLYLWWKRKLKMDLHFAPLLVYVVMLVASTVFSIVPDITWNGFYDMLESVYVLFGYCMICYYAFSVINTEKKLKIVIVAFSIGFLLMAMLGLSQFFGFDFLMSDLGKKLIIPSEYINTGDLKMVFKEGTVYGTLYNPNYMGVYCCMLCPLVLVLAISNKKRWHAVAALVALVLTEICFVGAGSKTTLILMMPFLVFIAICLGKKHTKQLIFVFVFAVAMFLLIDQYEVKGTHLVDKTVASITKESVLKNKDIITDITLEDKEYYVSYKDETFTVSYQEDAEGQLALTVKDKAGNILPLVFEKGEKENYYRFEDKEYESLYFVPSVDEYGNKGYYVAKGSARFFIYYSDYYKTYLYMNQFGYPTKLYTSETFESPILTMMGGFSNRGYIWSKSIPLLKETILIGSGPDTYAFMFPQYDYVSFAQYGFGNQLLTKPHSMYLQIGIQTGVVSLITFVCFYLWYFVDSFKLYRGRKLESLAERCGAAVFMATTGYMCAGFLHDSTVGTSIVFWTLIGIGLACNKMLAQPEEENMLQETENLLQETILSETEEI